MDLTEQIETIKKGYVAGKTAFQKDEDRAEEFDKTMKSVVDTIRSDAYAAFRAMAQSELDEAIRHVSELRWAESAQWHKEQGMGVRGAEDEFNPYTRENVRKAQEAAQEGRDDA